jgi:hypothetical protein
MELCSETVSRDYYSGGCSRKGVVKREGKLYCKQHDPVAVEARRKVRDEKWDKEWAESALRNRVEKIALKLYASLKNMDDLSPEIKELIKITELAVKND